MKAPRQYWICVLLLLNMGCSSLKKTDECKLYHQYLKEAWYRKPSGLFDLRKNPSYSTTKTEYGQTVNLDCLMGVKKRDIIKLLGEPTIINKNRLEYYFSEGCYREDKFECLRFVLLLDYNSRVGKVMPFVWESPPGGKKDD